MNIFLLWMGMWLDVTANILLFAPILAPLAYSIGIDPIHFSMIFVMNVNLGNITPPVGILLFATQAVGKVQMEPMVSAIIMVPLAMVGDVMKLCKERRGTQTKQTLLDPSHVMLEYYIPLAEVVTDFCDDLKSKTSGFASLDYEDAGYREAPLCLLEIMLNGKEVDSLSSVVHRDNAETIGRSICSRLCLCQSVKVFW
jgi:translation elongation factor EF-4